jgi:hypothetical protein
MWERGDRVPGSAAHPFLSATRGAWERAAGSLHRESHRLLPKVVW